MLRGAALEAKLPPDQQRIREKCFHPTGAFIPFQKEAIQQPIPARFEQMVRQYPHRLAVKTNYQAVTYDELNRQANRIAHAILAQCGEGQETIGLLLNHGIAMVAAVLGVLKTGEIYVPLDPTYPLARLTTILEDVQPSLIITDQAYCSLACTLAKNGMPVLNLDSISDCFTTASPSLDFCPDRLANILYTSGSTGQPKGVLQNHQNILHVVMRYTNSYHVCKEDRIALLSSFSTTGGWIHPFGALLNGAAIFPFDLKKEGLSNLALWLRDEEITLCTVNPSAFRHFAAFLQGGEYFPAVRVLSFSGEPVYRRDIEIGRDHFSPSCVFVNTLGTTEASWARQCIMDRQTEILRNTVPLGYALPDVGVALCDENGVQVGMNHIGEIIVSSPYLSPGYWRRPDLSEAKFSSPRGGDTRRYRTGDLGYMMPDGCLFYLGRKDHQVKVRGYRIEIAEIEGVLLEVDNVKQAVVILREDRQGDQRLVAYVVPFSLPVPTSSALRRAAAERLPDYMIPSVFVMLEALPFLPSGKLDRQALPTPNSIRPSLDAPFVAPRTPIEAKLIKIWSDVLQLQQVGIYDNFAELGGHSLLATQILSRVVMTFGVDLPVRILMEAPTVAEMAVLLAQHQGAQADPDTLARLLAEVEELSEEQARCHLADTPEPWDEMSSSSEVRKHTAN